jgi:DeoR/GlpR family transcriptional regulator of sugar metabolism
MDVLRDEGRIIAKDCATSLGLSEDTIRRDLRELAAEGKLQRVHGGALPASRAIEDLSSRRTISMPKSAPSSPRAIRKTTSFSRTPRPPFSFRTGKR